LSRICVLAALVLALALSWAGVCCAQDPPTSAPALAGIPAPVPAAAIRVTFYAHGWGAAPNGAAYAPHAFIRIEGYPDGGPPVDETYGFTATSLANAMAHKPGVIESADPRYLAGAHPYFWLMISDAQYHAVKTRIAYWKSPEGWAYNLWTRNCIAFAGDMAATMGLEPGTTRGWNPVVFMADTVKRNPGKLTSIQASFDIKEKQGIPTNLGAVRMPAEATP
jgi:hypothetical protein